MRRSPPARRLVAAVAVAGAVVGAAVFLTAVARHTRYGSSDNANALLAGQAMVHGNPLLRGWTVPHDSYWFLDLPLFGLASAVFGLRDGLLAAVPAAVDVATIVTGSVLAGLGLRSRGRWWVGTGVLLVLLGLPHPYLAIFVLQGPHHVATALVCLVAMALLADGNAGAGGNAAADAGAGIGRGRWWAAAGLLAVAVRSDPVALAIGVAPVAGAGVVAAVRSRRQGAVVGPVGAAAAGVVGAAVLGLVLRLAGGYRPLPDPPAIAAWGRNIRAVPRIFGGLLGVGGQGGLRGGPEAAHAAGAALLVAGIAVSAVRSLLGLVRPPAGTGTGEPGAAWLDDSLLLGCVGSVGLFAVLTDPQLQALNARYLLPALVFGAVLTARRAVEVAARVPGPAVAAAGLALACGYLPAPLTALRAPAPVNPTVTVAGWLDARGLHHGYGQYWVAGLMTVSGPGRVAVRPVVPDPDGTLRASDHFASRRWFGGHRFRFVVLDPAHPDGVDETAAVRTFGPPSETSDAGAYRVLLWDRDLAVAAIGPPSSPPAR